MEIREVVAAGPGWTRVRAEDGSTYTLSGNRNWRNNNPGNLEYGDYATRHGAVGTDGRFAVFPSYDTGRAAKENLLFSSPSYAGKTITDAVNAYAPPRENNTTAYTSRVARDIGVSPDTLLSDLNPDQRTRMLDSMQTVEGYQAGKAADQFGNPIDSGLLTSPQAQATTGIMSVLNPPTPTAAPDRGLLGDLQNSWNPATPAPVERAGLLSDPASVPGLSYPSQAPEVSAYAAESLPEQQVAQSAAFDVGRFGPQPTAPTAPTPSFDPGRFGPAPAPVANGMEQMRQGLLAQQLNEGILPSLQYTQPLQTVDPTLTAATPGYVDPRVTTQQAPSPVTVQAPETTRPATGLPSPEDRALSDAGGILQTQATPGLGALVDKEMGQRRMGGGLLGGLAGGILLGPLGAIAGGLLGKSYAQKTYFPPAPPAIDPKLAQQVAQRGLLGGNGGFAGLSDYGRSVAGSSGQFSGAVSSGSSGLW